MSILLKLKNCSKLTNFTSLARNIQVIKNFSISNETKTEIENLIKNNKVCVFMKGIPNAPKCGFSNAVTQILTMHGVNYESVDVLSNEEIRQGIKEYNNWPTIPQVFINGEFIGGCDILLQIHQNGQLIDLLKTAGIKSLLTEDSEKTKADK